MAFLLRSEIFHLTAPSPLRSDVDLYIQNGRRWRSWPHHHTKTFSWQKLASFPFFALLSVISGLVLHGVNSDCVVEFFFVLFIDQ